MHARERGREITTRARLFQILLWLMNVAANELLASRAEAISTRVEVNRTVLPIFTSKDRISEVAQKSINTLQFM